jgi:MoxR-like ATPase
VIDRTTGKETAGPQAILSGKDILEMRALAREVPIASHVKEFAARLVLATHPNGRGSRRSTSATAPAPAAPSRWCGPPRSWRS